MALDLRPKDSRVLAVTLLLIVLSLVYLVGVHWWFVSPHMEFFSRMGDLRDQQLRFRNIAAERADVDKQLAEVKAYEKDNQAFLPDADANAASASLIQRLKQSVGEHAPDANRCQVVSSQPYSGGDEELYKRVAIQVRMRCDLEPFASVIYDLENGKPYLFVDQVMLYKQQAYVPPGSKQPVSPLDIRFNLSGYLHQAGKPPK